MNSERGFTLLEVMMAMAIVMIAIVGFLAGAANTIRQRASLNSAQNAYAVATDVADSLSRLTSANTLIQPVSGNEKYAGYDGSGNLMKCAAGSLTATAPTTATDGTTEYSTPWNSASNLLYLYDNGGGDFASSVVASSANTSIDHPNATDLSNASTVKQTVDPVRRFPNGTTYYAVWSVVYMPCGTTATDKVKIFITVYWIDPEPAETTVAAVQTKLASGAYKIKKVSLTIDKAYKVEG